MPNIFFKLLFLFSFFIISGCQSFLLRLPASMTLNYDPERSRLLSEAAQNGIMYQFDDEYLRDIPNVQISDTCNYPEPSEWGNQFFSIMRIFERNTEFYKKIHIIQFKRGDKPSADITRELDGTAYLVLTYQKVQHRENISDDWRRKCDTYGDTRDQVTINQMQWPETSRIENLLAGLPNKPTVARFEFDKDFLTYLAQRTTILRISPALAAEKSFPSMKPILPDVMNQLGQQAKSGRYKYIDYYLQEIDHNSKLGGQIKFFSIIQDQGLERGIGLDGLTRTTASALGQQLTSTYMFISYRSRGNEYEFSTLHELDQCLKTSSISEKSSKPERFLAPGFSCGAN
jgi:hypothetical protein